MPTTTRGRIEAVGIMALVGCLWGSSFAVPLILGGTNPFVIVGARYVLYGAVSLFLLSQAITVKHLPWRRAFLHAGVGYVGLYLGEVIAIRLAGAAPTVAVLGTIPVVYALLGSRRDGFAILSLGPSLILLVLGHLAIHSDGFALGGTSPIAAGVGLLIAVVVVGGWCWYALDNTDFLRARPDIGPAEWSSAVGAASGVLALPLLIGGLFMGGSSDSVALVAGIGLFLAIGPSWIATAGWNQASLKLPRALAGQLVVFEPLSGFFFIHLYTGEFPSAMVFTGEILLLIGSGLALRALTRTPVATEDPATRIGYDLSTAG